MSAIRMGVRVSRDEESTQAMEIEDGLWERVEPLLPVVERRYPYPGRKRLDDLLETAAGVERGRRLATLARATVGRATGG